MGSGIVRSSPIPPVIFDTSDLNAQQQTLLDGSTFDGQNVYVGLPLSEVSDTVYGVHLAVTLSDVRLLGSATTRVCVIGDTFGDELVHDELWFEDNVTKVTANRYKRIRAILFNDFAGNLRGSASLALALVGTGLSGRCVIREAGAMEVSPDTFVAAQMAEPSMFFQNFVPATYTMTVNTMLQDAIGSDASIDDLGIGLNSASYRTLDPGDMTTRIGQKFRLDGGNIQKISVLLSTVYDETDGYDWSGSIVMSLHVLQSEVSCPVEPVPDNAVDFDPNPAVIAQLSIDAATLLKQGVQLDGYPQIVDFVFTGTTIADPVRSSLESGSYYAFALSRSGDTQMGTLRIEEASNRYDHGYMLYFDGSQWVNLYDSDMWFGVEGDYVKVVDGIAYKDGIGVEVPKVAKNETNTEVPFVESLVPYYTSTYDAYNYVLLEKDEGFSDQQQDQRTGNWVYSRLYPTPTISLISESSLDTLLLVEGAPLLLARAKDANPRGNPSSVSGTTPYVGLATGSQFNILAPDADLRSFNWTGSMLLPNVDKTHTYRIAAATLVADAYGDADGDGSVTQSDYELVTAWLTRWGSYVSPTGMLNLADAYLQQQIVDGYLDAIGFLRADTNGDGYVDASDANSIYRYVNKLISTFSVGSSFPRMRLDVENLLASNPLVDIPATDSVFATVPFAEVDWTVEFFSTWHADSLIVEDLRRDMPTTFTDGHSSLQPGGQNNFYVPGDLMIGGDILNPDTTSYSVDFEANQITLDVPIVDSYGSPIFVDGYTGILLFDSFVCESSGGLTAAGFPAMKYSDGTYVQGTAFTAGKVKIVPVIQSTAEQYAVPFGGTIDDIVGMYYSPSSSLMTLYIKDQYDDDGYGNVLRPKSTKINVTVYLKKAGFANTSMEVTQGQMLALLGL
jgi:hypothetical protein